MINFYSVKFSPGHLDVMRMRPEEIAGSAYDDVKKRVVDLVVQSEQAETFLYDGRIIAIMGFIILWPGVIQGWIVPSKYVYTAPVGFAKMVKRYVEAIAKTFKCHRFQTGSFNDEFHARWMKFLGFKSEGISEKFTPDKRDYVNYARLF